MLRDHNQVALRCKRAAGRTLRSPFGMGNSISRVPLSARGIVQARA